MKRLNGLIAEMMGVVPGENYIGEIRAAQSILRFIEDERDYKWAATYFHSGTDGPTIFSTHNEITPGTEHPIASVHAGTFALAASLVFVATEETLSVEAKLPRYEHGCNLCTFLGQYGEYDLYHCTYYNRHETLIARWSDDNADQLFGASFDGSSLGCAISKARELARDAGLTKQ